MSDRDRARRVWCAAAVVVVVVAGACKKSRAGGPGGVGGGGPMGLPVEVAVARIDTVRDGHEYRVTVTLRGTIPPGRVQANLELHTDHPEQPVVSVPISVTKAK